MTSAFSWQNSVSLCPSSFCTPRPNLLVTPGISWLATFALQSPMMKRANVYNFNMLNSYNLINILIINSILSHSNNDFWNCHWTSFLQIRVLQTSWLCGMCCIVFCSNWLIFAAMDPEKAPLEKWATTSKKCPAKHISWCLFSGALWWSFGPSPPLSADVKFFLLSNLILGQPFVASIAVVKNLLTSFDSALTSLLLPWLWILVWSKFLGDILPLLISSFLFLSLLNYLLNIFYA